MQLMYAHYLLESSERRLCRYQSGFLNSQGHAFQALSRQNRCRLQRDQESYRSNRQQVGKLTNSVARRDF
jgi:hypothetical protein